MMSGSQIQKADVLFSIYQNPATVFRLLDVALITGITNRQLLSARLNYYVRNRKLQNPRKGIYTKANYSTEELACKLFTPSYISLEYVLQKSGVVFQYDAAISSVSYLSRSIGIESQSYTFRKIKSEILVNDAGINRLPNGVNIASPERSLLDLLYLNPVAWFDNIHTIDVKKVMALLPFYQSVALTARTKKLFEV
jgi:hypothetical protein